MKNKKGFTLIELLAVIIILAVIALIATPVVLNVVDNAKKNANKNSAYGLIDAARLYYADSLMDLSMNSKVNGTTNLINEIKVSGDRPDSGYLYINSKGEISLAVVYDDVCYSKGFEEDKLIESDDIENCITTQYVCIKSETTTLGVLATDDNPYVNGAEYNCDVGGEIRTFFVLKEDSNSVSLIMDSNIGISEWISLEDYEAAAKADAETKTCETLEQYGPCSYYGPITAINHLNSLTADWQNVEVSLPDRDLLESFKVEETYEIDGAPYKTINYPEWLYSNLDAYTGEEGVNLSNFAYHVNYIDKNGSAFIYLMSYNNLSTGITYYSEELGGGQIIPTTSTSDIGVRPVITVSKDLMK